MDLHTSGHRRGVVCAPHHAAVEAGRAALAEGGNALEAMVAMAATIAAVYPHMNHIGGDGLPAAHLDCIKKLRVNLLLRRRSWSPFEVRPAAGGAHR